MTAFAPPVPAGDSAPDDNGAKARKKPSQRKSGSSSKRPSRWSLWNWPVRWKVVAIALVPIALACTFGGLRIATSITNYRDLRLVADRAQLVYPIESYMSAMDGVLLAGAGVGDPPSALRDFDARRSELQQRLNDTNVAPEVRSGITAVLNDGQTLRDQVASNGVNVRQEVIEYAPMLIAAEDAISASVRVNDDVIRTQAQGLSRAVGHRGQMLMLQLLVDQGGQLPEPEVRTSMITVAGTEPSTVLGLGQLLGTGSPDAVSLREQMVKRMAIMGDPGTALVGNPDLRQSIQTSDQIINKVISDTTGSVTKAVNSEANTSRNAAIRDSAIVLAAIIAVLLLVYFVARSLVLPLRTLRAGALRVAHDDLAKEIDAIKDGGETPAIEPIPVHTSEEIGQVAHAVDELHEQALMMAGEQAALQLQIGDMFETLSRRSRTLVDQQLSLIDGLESNEADPDRLDSLFRLDHLAARMRRNGANLLVLSGATMHREQADPMPLAAVINAAASEVEDYRRVTTSTVPDSALVGSVVADVIHLLAELLDNALRYSPPTSPVRVSAVHTGNGGLVIEVTDTGLGMTEADLRMANTRLKSGGEVTPFTARHMGLFVVGRLAQQHGLVVRLRTSLAGEARSGTTAGVYVPADLITTMEGEGQAGPQEVADVMAPEPQLGNGLAYADGEPTGQQFVTDPEPFAQPYVNGSGPLSGSTLPRRTPGRSGITGVPAPPPRTGAGEPPHDAHEDAHEEPQHDAREETTRIPADTSGFFSSRAQVAANGEAPAAEPDASPPHDDASPPDDAPPAATPEVDDNPIFTKMVSEWLIDFNTLTEPPQSWQSVWDHGWAAAANAEEAPIQAHTDKGLPIRQPGARLVPGGAESMVSGHSNGAHRRADDDEVASISRYGFGRHELGDDAVPLRDPAAVRAMMSNHFGGVRAARTHTREANEGMDTE
jgi:signal transduction histidine kinase